MLAFGEARRQSRHSRRSYQQSLRRREACRGFGGARRQSRNRKKKLGAKPPRDGFGGCSALPSLVESLDHWPGHAKLQRSRQLKTPVGLRSSLGTVRKSSEQSLARDGSARRREVCRAFGGARRQSRNRRISSEAAAKQLSCGLRSKASGSGRRQSRRQSRHSRMSSQQSLRRREACRGFGSLATVRKSSEPSVVRDGFGGCGALPRLVESLDEWPGHKAGEAAVSEEKARSARLARRQSRKKKLGAKPRQRRIS